MKRNRIISTALSMLMLMTLLTAFPAVKIPTIVSAATTNVAPLAQYYGTGGTNGTGSYGEANWTAYHAGKLNDGVIPTDYAQNTTGQNLELATPDINNAAANSWIYIYFQLDQTYSISTVNVYANFRQGTSAANRAYPDQITVSVGSSETSNTSLGTTTESSYNTAVKKFTASGSKSGDFVAIGVHVPSGYAVVCISEIQILAEAGGTSTSKNIASASTYRGTAGQNGTGQYSDNGITDAQWQAYHTGKLNDGVIATDYVNIDTGKGVDLLTANETLYFKLDQSYTITEVKVYTLDRSNVLTRAHPQSVTVSVGTSETSTAALTSGALPDATKAVATYTATGSVKGNYVVIQAKAGITEENKQAGSIVFTEVEIYGYADANALSEPKLIVSNMSNTTKNRSGRYATFTVPTFSWNAVQNATSYDVYLNGNKVASDLTTTSYTPMLTAFDQYGKGDNRACEKVYIVAKGNGYSNGTSETIEFLYVPMPTDKNGNPVTAADFIIDAGHGGADSGATLDTRYEKDDNLNLAMKTGALLEAAGFSVAYTRTTDVFHSVSTKAAKSHAGNFRAFLCFHRNSTAGAVGTEYYAHSADSASKALSAAIEAEVVADAIWRNRGQKTNDALGILMGNVNIPTVLLEIGFISTASDNTLFDTYFNEHAQAIARGAMKYLGYSIGYTGYVDVPQSAAISGSATTVSATAGNYGSTASLGVAGWILNSYGVNKVQYSTDGSTWKEANSTDRSGELGAYTTFANKANSGYNATISTAGWTAGSYTVQFRGISNWEATTKYTQTLPLVNVNLTVNDTTPKEYTVRFLIDGVAVSTQTVKEGDSAIAPTTPIKEGHTFDKWDADYSNITENLDINALFTKNSYTVRFLVDGEEYDSQTVKYGEAAVAPVVPRKIGYKFDKWEGDYSNIISDTDITAVFAYDEAQWFTVTYVVPENATSDDTLVFGPFVIGTAWADAQITEPAVDGVGLYVFKGWDIAAPETITENIVFMGKVELEGMATVTVTSTDGGVIFRDVNGETVVGAYSFDVAAGTLFSDLELPIAICNTGCKFDGWFIGDTLASADSIIDANITVTAKFSKTGVAFGEYTVSGDNTDKTVTVNVNSDVDLTGAYMTVFYQSINGTTAVSTTAIQLQSTSTEGEYTVSVQILNGNIASIDVIITADIIDFASSKWSTLASVVGIDIDP